MSNFLCVNTFVVVQMDQKVMFGDILGWRQGHQDRYKDIAVIKI